MDTLPPELILGIIKHLPRSDLPSARAVCRIFMSFATSLLFCTVQVSLTRKGLVKLHSIACAPNLQDLVKELIINAHKLQKYNLISFHAARNHANNRCPLIVDEQRFLCRSAEESMQELDPYLEYRKAYSDQQDFERSGTDHRRLSEAFNLMKNIRTVLTSNSSDCYELTADFQILYRKDAYGLPLEGSCQDLLPKLIRALFDSRLKIKSLMLGSFRVYVALFDARLSSKTLCEAFDLSSEFYWQYSLRKLRDMELTGLDWGTDGYISDKTISNFRNLLLSAPSLERLVIGSIGYNLVPLPEIFGTHTLQHLHHVEFSCVELMADDLVTFLCRHASTLENVRLYAVCLTGEAETDRWSSVLEKLRTFGFPKLNAFALERCHGEHSRSLDHAAKRYIRCESDANPCLTYEMEVETETDSICSEDQG